MSPMPECDGATTAVGGGSSESANPRGTAIAATRTASINARYRFRMISTSVLPVACDYK